ncbi:hypothetical protein CJU90_2281 [Yarrowia sp. C11]|nr:hypothetical protein CKK34_6309 [Yarrowia sp. E02]KAG5372199.1 hypothetical protein CJU90_2281 [Yarrowia sp. C11]
MENRYKELLEFLENTPETMVTPMPNGGTEFWVEAKPGKKVFLDRGKGEEELTVEEAKVWLKQQLQGK